MTGVVDIAAKRNCFERLILITKIISYALLSLIAGGAVMILCSVLFRDDFGAVRVNLLVTGIFLIFVCLAGSLMTYMLRLNVRAQYERLKTVLSEGEIAEIKGVFFAGAAIAKKAARLMEEGAAKNDMGEYERFRELVAMAGFRVSG